MSGEGHLSLLSILLVGCGISLVACEADGDSPLGPVPSMEAPLAAVVKSASPIVAFPDGIPSTGTSALSRTPNGVSFTGPDGRATGHASATSTKR